MTTQDDVRNMFVICAMIHNMLLEHDGYLDDNLPSETPGGAMEAIRRRVADIRGPGVWLESELGVNDVNLERHGHLASASDREMWRERIEAIAVHQENMDRTNRLDHR